MNEKRTCYNLLFDSRVIEGIQKQEYNNNRWQVTIFSSIHESLKACNR